MRIIHFLKLKHLGLIVALCLIGLIIAYATWSFLVWNQLNTSSVSVYTNAKQTVIDSLSQKQISIKNIQSLSDEVSLTTDSICAPALLRWQIAISPGLRQKQESCIQTKRSLEIISSNIQDIAETLRTYQVIEAELSTAINGASSSAHEPITKAWQAAYDNIDSLSVRNDLLSLKKELLSKIFDIIAATKQVSSADQRQNRADFDQASDNLALSFKNLSEISVQSDETYRQIVDVLSASLAAP